MLSIISAAAPRTYLLQSDRQPVASLKLARSLQASGEIRTVDGIWPVTGDARRWSHIAVGDGDRPILELRRTEATVPGVAHPVPWELRGRFSRFHAVLGADRETIVLDCSGWGKPHATVQVSGSWEYRDVTVLACFFAMMARRRRAIILLSS